MPISLLRFLPTSFKEFFVQCDPSFHGTFCGRSSHKFGGWGGVAIVLSIVQQPRAKNEPIHPQSDPP